jgi:hypothetical protein
VASRSTAIFVCLAAGLLLLVLVDGWAVAFLPRVVEKLVVLGAFLVLVYVAVIELRQRRV